MFGWVGGLLGIILLILGGLFIFVFPAATSSAKGHQPDSFAVNGIVFGFVLAIIGAVLLFLP